MMNEPVALGESYKIGSRRVVVRGNLRASAGFSPGVVVELEDGAEALLWWGDATWGRRVLDILQRCAGVVGMPRVLEADISEEGTLEGRAALLVSGPPPGAEVFDAQKWRRVDTLAGVDALCELAEVIGAIHRAGGTLRGLRLEELFLDVRQGRVFLAAMPRLGGLEWDKPEAVWRDIRVFGELAFENMVRRECLDGHALVALLQDRSAMARAGLTYPGLNQILAGCVTPYGELAYGSVDDLLAGLMNFRAELERPLTLRVGASSTLGSYIFRHNNQDSCGHVVVESSCGSRRLRTGFFCVADGIGGIEDGEHASRLAVEAATAAFVRAWSFYGAEALEGATVPFARGIARVTSQRLALEGEFARENHRGGTTFTGLLIAGGRAGICHIGDSRAVLVRGQQCIALTEDHSLARILVRLGVLSEEEAAKDKTSQRTISRFMSTSGEVECERIDRFASGLAERFGVDEEELFTAGLEIRPGDLFLITSDGAHDEIDRAGLLDLASRFAGDPQQLCEAITRNAVMRIGRDNATALAVLVEG